MSDENYCLIHAIRLTLIIRKENPTCCYLTVTSVTSNMDICLTQFILLCLLIYLLVYISEEKDLKRKEYYAEMRGSKMKNSYTEDNPQKK